jgi:hypothetical protein
MLVMTLPKAVSIEVQFMTRSIFEAAGSYTGGKSPLESGLHSLLCGLPRGIRINALNYKPWLFRSVTAMLSYAPV